MLATSGWKADRTSKGSLDIRLNYAQSGTGPGCSRPLLRLAQGCLLLCLARTLIAGALVAAPLQEAPREGAPTTILGGPFPVRSLAPVQLLFFQFTPERAVPVPPGMWNLRFDLVEANNLARGEHRGDSFLFDFELTRANLALQYGAQLGDPAAVYLEGVFGRTYQGV